MPKLESASAPSQPPSPWQYKPWWCQPWSIALTGVGLIGGSWILLERWWLTLLIGIPVTVWMAFFLLLWPRLMVESGLLDSLGEGKDL
ncbi:DUF6737 family protein [Pseudanabaena sp. FACHB-2040]|uniref:DUF6737 family protein n=1 Tax=Pseudanabaena sp. FACHB-2040 TaxID=2692859 RepID=UPI00168700CF|nr:DUF6737 family protein [Pseudanabaena sp. FACHB-2040]MBD2257520.1 hypothetical protein [Pseudanabaena sp. FACHB-2040]